MNINLSGLVLAGSAWLAAVVLAWPAHRPYVALVVLGAYVLLMFVIEAVSGQQK